jgi:hypothetical protein
MTILSILMIMESFRRLRIFVVLILNILDRLIIALFSYTAAVVYPNKAL